MTSKENTASVCSPYNGGITREQFLFYEMRTTARLMSEGLEPAEIIDRIVAENLFQYPTEKTLRNLARVCVRRLEALDDPTLVTAITRLPAMDAKQICLYAMMRQNRLVRDFMVTVIGEKFRQQDLSFGKVDVNAFLLRLQEQDDAVAAWAPSTLNKIRQVLTKLLVENEYLDRFDSPRLNPVLLNTALENTIRSNNDLAALPAFNCFY